MTGTASILPRTMAALTALLLAAGLFAWMNAAGDAIAASADSLNARYEALEATPFRESLTINTGDLSADEIRRLDFSAEIVEYAEVPIPDDQPADDEEAEAVENPFGLISCYVFWADWALWARFLGPFFTAGAITFFLAVNKGLLRGGRQLEGA